MCLAFNNITSFLGHSWLEMRKQHCGTVFEYPIQYDIEILLICTFSPKVVQQNVDATRKGKQVYKSVKKIIFWDSNVGEQSNYCLGESVKPPEHEVFPRFLLYIRDNRARLDKRAESCQI